MTNYFELFGLPRKFDIAAADLDKRYRELSRELHPDRFASAPPAERRVALERSTALNEAYRTLKDPVRRATHFVQLCGLPLDAEGPEGRSPVQLSPEFLEGFLAVREQFEEHKGNPAVRAETRTYMARERSERLDRLSSDLGALSAEPTRGQLMPLAQRLLELRYYARFLEELEADEETEIVTDPAP